MNAWKAASLYEVFQELAGGYPAEGSKKGANLPKPKRRPRPAAG